MAILSAIFVILAVTLMPTLRSTLNQQSEINDLRAHLDQRRETVAAMQREQRQWSDPAFVEQQARERLKFLRVGETSYTVIDAEAAHPNLAGPKIAAPAHASTAHSPWYGQLWQSMVLADTATATGETPAKAPVSGKPSPAPSTK